MPKYSVTFNCPFEYEDIQATNAAQAFEIASRKAWEDMHSEEFEKDAVNYTDVVVTTGKGKKYKRFVVSPSHYVSNADADEDAARERKSGV